ncbi:MAG: flagellin [Lachnospiraceae bacterium]|nr:flagellin [Lachnospiraceae bacterium]
MRINHNISALQTNAHMRRTDNALDKAMERLSSGFKINKASDDAAGMAISRKMKTQIAGLERSSMNCSDGISVIQTAEGALNEVSSILQRCRELAVQSANDTYSDDDRAAVQLEIDQLMEEIQRISDTTEFNTKTLLDGNLAGEGTLVLQVGANEDQTMEVEIPEISPETLGLTDPTDPDYPKAYVKISDHDKADQAISLFDNAMRLVSETRAQLGAYQNRLEHTVENLDTASYNMTEAVSRIEDADMAEQMTVFTQQNVLQQAGTSMLAQANERPQTILSLLNS